ncbi:MAG TPA: hypothetical protein VIY47_09645 [Ignavibacteriaceae bacterium]
MDLSDHDLGFPETTEIAKSIGLPRHKVTGLVQDLYVDMLEYFSDNSLTIKEAVQVLYIHFPYDEEDKIHKSYKEEAKQMSLWLQVQLPVIPRLAEEISLNFIENGIKYDHGFVTEISHEVSCLQQRTIIHVHPLKNYYHQWDKLRVKHEFDLKSGESPSATFSK